MREEKGVLTETTEAAEPAGPEISGQKFHRLFGRDLAVALEATFAGDTEIKFSDETSQSEWFSTLVREIKPAPEIHLTKEQSRRVYFPAMLKLSADMAAQKEGEIKFLPWVDETEVQFHRLVFRLRPTGEKKIRWVRFGRFEEDNAFGFNLWTESAYINLDFFSKRANEFVPLYVKVQVGADFVYFLLSAEAREEAVTLKVRRVEAAAVPPHLAEAKPV